MDQEMGDLTRQTRNQTAGAYGHPAMQGGLRLSTNYCLSAGLDARGEARLRRYQQGHNISGAAAIDEHPDHAIKRALRRLILVEKFLRYLCDGSGLP